MPNDVVKKGLGWRPDVPDIRDEPFTYQCALRNELLSMDQIPVRNIVPWRYKEGTNKEVSELPIFDQGQTSSCTGQSTGAMIDLVSGLVPRSRLLLYWYGREKIGETDQDNGAYIRDVIKGAADRGAGAERYWAFDEHRVTDRPEGQVLQSANKHKVQSYHRLQCREDYLSCLTQGYPFVIGFTCYGDFIANGGPADRFGILNYPEDINRNYGGHAVCVIGFDLQFQESEWARNAANAGLKVPNEVYIVRNSWGKEWGHEGNFAVDCAYFENNNLADDAWTVRM